MIVRDGMSCVYIGYIFRIFGEELVDQESVFSYMLCLKLISH